VNASILDTYIATIDARFAPAVRALHRAVLDACPDLNVKISYRMLMYAIKGDFRHWVCAVGVTTKAAHLRFLFGTLLDDSRGVLRAGTSTLKTIDFHSAEEVDPELVADYVGQAVARLDYFRAHEHER